VALTGGQYTNVIKITSLQNKEKKLFFTYKTQPKVSFRKGICHDDSKADLFFGSLPIHEFFSCGKAPIYFPPGAAKEHPGVGERTCHAVVLQPAQSTCAYRNSRFAWGSALR
jgi:hypothetical protein